MLGGVSRELWREGLLDRDGMLVGVGWGLNRDGMLCGVDWGLSRDEVVWGKLEAEQEWVVCSRSGAEQEWGGGLGGLGAGRVVGWGTLGIEQGGCWVGSCVGRKVGAVGWWEIAMGRVWQGKGG